MKTVDKSVDSVYKRQGLWLIIVIFVDFFVSFHKTAQLSRFAKRHFKGQ
jgi:hypothetical protein